MTFTYYLSVGKVFDKICLMQDYVKLKLPSWCSNKIQSEPHCLDIFAYLREQQRPFSIINDVLGPDKGQMSLETLEAILNVKFNKKMSCVQFYHSIKDDKVFLKKVQGSDK